MTEPVFGYSQSRPNDEPVPVLGADFSKPIIFETSADADDTMFPEGEPVRISTSDPEALAKLGTGGILDAIKAINSQLTGLNRGADATIFRVAEGTDTAATAANIAAALGQISYVASEVNATPRLVWAGRTGWRADAQTVNPVVAALPAACEAVLGVAPVDVRDTSSALAIADRETMSSQRLMPIGVAARVYEGASVVTRPMGPRVLGLFIRVDNENEGKPFDPIANRAIYGLAGLSRAIPFSLLDGSTEGQQMLDAEVSIVAKGEVNVDGAIAEGGYSFIGTDNTDTGELWKQIHQVRGADYITVKLIQITRQFLGKKITADLVEAYVNSILFMLRDHKAADDILGYNQDVFIPDQNSPEQIRLGRIKLDLGIEPAPVFKRAHNDIHRYRPAVEGLVADIVARLSISS
ncbi:phage tail protein [Aurantimonas sp. VKM B-3413]|uniref:phage tail protein n=1 Tax=Aurantimonas sp. VKM B-3413 TaxID=2779401 RepID=UPI001E38467F|nr:phage tail protein [Aurantimonas sp. VKM B-3413]MCB8835927.1 phage tail protein [Aurantimonas sp. VKM B-3413]